MATLLAVCLSLFGCHSAPPPPPAPTVILPKSPNPSVAEHPLRDRFIGRWESEAQSEFSIQNLDGGEVQIAFPTHPHLQTIVTNVRWDVDDLVFDRYEYLAYESAPPWDPYDEVKVTIALRLTDSEDTLLALVTEPESDEPRRFEFSRRAESQASTQD